MNNNEFDRFLFYSPNRQQNRQKNGGGHHTNNNYQQHKRQHILFKMSGGGRGGPDPVDLWVRAGSDGIRNGADPVCQQIFMVLLQKVKDQSMAAAGGNLVFNVKVTNPAKPHSEFREAGLRHTPGLVHGGEIVELPDDILEYIDHRWPKPPLQYFDPDADDACADLFKKFCWFIKEVNKDPKGLETELYRLDTYLREASQEFLTGNTLSHLDCRILPYLQHIRIAAAALKSYEIPTDFRGLWSYLRTAYAEDSFQKTCPSDQEIILYWSERKDTPNLPQNKIAELTRSPPVFTMTVPPE